MGMDLSGKSPTSDAGRDFRNNIWWWHGLPYYIEETHPDLYAKCRHWHTNDGDGLNADDSSELANRLRDDIAKGRVQKFAETYEGRFSVENVEKFAAFLADCGGFEIY